jgi:hypothetical protein
VHSLLRVPSGAVVLAGSGNDDELHSFIIGLAEWLRGLIVIAGKQDNIPFRYPQFDLWFLSVLSFQGGSLEGTLQ